MIDIGILFTEVAKGRSCAKELAASTTFTVLYRNY